MDHGGRRLSWHYKSSPCCCSVWLANTAAKRPRIARDISSAPNLMARRSAVREISSFRAASRSSRSRAELAKTRFEVIGALIDAVFDFGVVIRAEEILFLPLVGLLADVDDLPGDDMPPLCAAPVRCARRSETSPRAADGIGRAPRRRSSIGQARTGLPVSRSNAVLAASPMFRLNGATGFGWQTAFAVVLALGLPIAPRPAVRIAGGPETRFRKLNGFTWSPYSRPALNVLNHVNNAGVVAP